MERGKFKANIIHQYRYKILNISKPYPPMYNNRNHYSLGFIPGMQGWLSSR